MSYIFVRRCEGSLTPSPGCQKSPKDHLLGSLPPPRPLSSPDAHISIISTDTEKKMRKNGKSFLLSTTAPISPSSRASQICRRIKGIYNNDHKFLSSRSENKIKPCLYLDLQNFWTKLKFQLFSCFWSISSIGRVVNPSKKDSLQKLILAAALLCVDKTKTKQWTEQKLMPAWFDVWRRWKSLFCFFLNDPTKMVTGNHKSEVSDSFSERPDQDGYWQSFMRLIKVYFLNDLSRIVIGNHLCGWLKFIFSTTWPLVSDQASTSADTEWKTSFIG